MLRQPDALHPSVTQLRPLASSDYARGHLTVLADLTKTPDIGEQAWTERFQLIKKSNGTYYILVAVDKETDQLVATGSLLLEHKFLRGAGKCGHIEDIAVSKQAQGKKVGYFIVTALTELAERVGCYKSILDCSEENRGQRLAEGGTASD